MDEEEIMELFNSHWFELEILRKVSVSSNFFDFPQNPERKTSKLEVPRPLPLRRSATEDLSSNTSLSFVSGSLSPDSVLFATKLQSTTTSKEMEEPGPEQGLLENTEHGAEVEAAERKNMGNRKGRRRQRSKIKSLSDLEFEELKGFMDLGFVFSEEDKKDSSLALIIPGLQRLGSRQGVGEEGEEEVADESGVSRPYLSEAWELSEKSAKENPLMNWKFPGLSSEIDIKHRLRWWAHTVASTVR